MTVRRHRLPGAAKSRGAVLIILMALLAMGVLYFITAQLEALSLNHKELKGETDALSQAREALLAYATTYRDTHDTEVYGYLPCPDTTGDGEADPPCGTDGQASIGLLPYKTLGLPDLRDSAGVCLWYAVSSQFKATTNKATPMNWDTQGQFQVVDAQGASLIAPDDSQGGAAAVVFAAGAPLTGQNRGTSASGPCAIDPTQVAAYLDAGYNFATSSTVVLTQGSNPDASGITTNNDRLAWVTPKEVFDRVVKRQDFSNALAASPPGQINTLIDRLAKALETKVQNDIFNATATSMPLNTASYAPQPGGAAMGDVDPGMNIGLTNAVSYANYLTNWADQFRLIRCNSLSAPCLAINNGGTANCRGALAFGGRTATGQPRTGAQKLPSVAGLANYFESALGLLTSAGSFTGNGAFSASGASLDAAACLGAGTYVSLKGESAQFAIGTVMSGGGGDAVAQVTGVGGGSPEIVLGSTTTTARSGCIWYPTPISVGTSLRLYFTYRIDAATTGSTARGYTLTLADATTNSPYLSDPLMCGASGSTRLGYAGAPPSGTATVSGVAALITGASWSPSTLRATISTAADHGFNPGETVTIAGISPTGYNGVYTIVSLPSSTSFTYSVAYPGPARAGIAVPKLGVEFDTNVDSSRNDPSAEHFALLYWGSMGDNNLDARSNTRDGADDNSHGAGVASDGSQPLNPRSLTTTSASATRVANIAAAQWSAGTATITTSAPHGIANGQRVVITDTSALGYKGTHIATVTDTTHFTYPVAAAPGAYPYVATVAAATWSSNVATITTSAAHGLSTGYSVTLSNMSPSAWNGTYVVTVIDDTHFTYTLGSNPGIYASGGQVSYPLSWVNTASWSGGIVTVTTASNHKLTSNQYATVSGIYPAGYNGTYRVTVIDDTHFSYALANPATNPGGYISGGLVAIAGMTSTVMPAAGTNVAGAFWTNGGGGLTVITTAAAHGLSSGQTVHINNVVSGGPASYNGVYVVTVIDATNFYYARVTDPGAYVGGGVAAAAAPAIATINSAAWSATGGGTATLGTAAAHGFASGQLVSIGGIEPSAYNGSRAITVIDATHFSYALAGDPGGSFAATSFARPGIATVKSSDPYLPYGGSMPTDTDIHVRVDLVRGYDATKHQATLTMKAYVGDTFALTGNCGQTEFTNFARDLADLCPQRAATVAQDGIVINDVAGPALAQVYFGFTTGRGSSANDNETIILKNLILRSQ